MIRSVPADSFRPRGYSYAYLLRVDWKLPRTLPLIFDVERRIPIAVQARPLELSYCGGTRFTWCASSVPVANS